MFMRRAVATGKSCCGLFTNRTVFNHLGGGLTVFAPLGEALPVWQAAARYGDAGLPTCVR